MKCNLRLFLSAVGFFFHVAVADGVTPRSPENQVFQFMQNGVSSKWTDGSSNTASAYLWIPEKCLKVRGLLILCANVPEHRLVGHPAIREACAANDLGIVWCVPTFMNFRKDTEKKINNALDAKTSVDLLQELLEGLATQSGYDEVARVPWLPIGESGHLLMVDALVESQPQRCLAGVWLKNHHLPPQNRTVPAFVAFGTAQEWAQTQTDIRTKWNDVSKSMESVIEQRKRHPNWPLSYMIDGGSGHFDCSEKLTTCLARYIDCVAKARLSDDWSLKPIAIESGWLADLAIPGRAKKSPLPVAAVVAGERALPWFFDRESAEIAQSFADINWKAETQLPGFADESGKVVPFQLNGISSFEPQCESDGITFTLRGVMLDQLPQDFVISAGSKLAKAPGAPTLEWLCGPVKPLGADRFQICLDRSFPSSACYIAARQSGTETIRSSVQPCHVKIQKNARGRAQILDFQKITDVKAGTMSIPLVAKTDSGLPVKFFVRAGPAEVHGDQLVFMSVPPRTKFPLAVTVVAWQFGRAGAAPLNTETVEQTFHILAP